jgi:hypothetical protein
VKFRPLNPHQHELLEEIESHHLRLREFDGHVLDDLGIAEKEEFCLILEARDTFIARALRTMVKKGPDNEWYLHPEIPHPWRKLFKNWVLTHRALGNRKLLRRTKTGIEKGVKRPMNLNRVPFLEEVWRLRNRGEEDSAEEIIGHGKTITEILALHRRVFDPDRHLSSIGNQPQKRSLRSIFHILRRKGAIPPMTYRNFLKIIKTYDPHLLRC